MESIPYYYHDVPPLRAMCAEVADKSSNYHEIYEVVGVVNKDLVTHAHHSTSLKATKVAQEQATFNDLSLARKGIARPVSICP
jgi:hypothetical protein